MHIVFVIFYPFYFYYWCPLRVWIRVQISFTVTIVLARSKPRFAFFPFLSLTNFKKSILQTCVLDSYRTYCTTKYRIGNFVVENVKIC